MMKGIAQAAKKACNQRANFFYTGSAVTLLVIFFMFSLLADGYMFGSNGSGALPLPRTGLGKLDRKALRTGYWEGFDGKQVL